MNLLPIVIIGGILYFVQEGQKVKDQLKWNITRISIDTKKTNIENLVLSAKFHIINPTQNKLRIISIVGSVYLKGQDLPFRMLTPTEIPPLSEKDINVIISVPVISAGTLVADLIKEISAKKPIEAVVEGSINLPFGTISFSEMKRIL